MSAFSWRGLTPTPPPTPRRDRAATVTRAAAALTDGLVAAELEVLDVLRVASGHELLVRVEVGGFGERVVVVVRTSTPEGPASFGVSTSLLDGPRSGVLPSAVELDAAVARMVGAVAAHAEAPTVRLGVVASNEEVGALVDLLGRAGLAPLDRAGPGAVALFAAARAPWVSAHLAYAVADAVDLSETSARGVALASGVLADLAAGVPVEWALRRAAGGER